MLAWLSNQSEKLFLPALLKVAARLTTVVVLPYPPFIMINRNNFSYQSPINLSACFERLNRPPFPINGFNLTPFLFQCPSALPLEKGVYQSFPAPLANFYFSSL
ncbi:hypothetical protein BGS_1058 [Beggiatoa sp. SS]|nr:hypothetical protein BGS_1058 [Beggiatoa sp. SS]